MRRTLALAFFALSCAAYGPSVRAQTWSADYAGLAASRVAVTADGGMFVAGASSPGAVQGSRLDALGDVAWVRTMTYPGALAATVTRVLALPDGGALVVGAVSSTGDFDGYDAWILRVDAGGAVTWQTRLGGPRLDLLADADLLSDGGFALAGTSYTDAGTSDGWVVRLDANGGLRWSRIFSGGPGISAGFAGIARRGADRYTLTGSLNGNGTILGWIASVRENGILDWQRGVTAPTALELGDVVVTPDGRAIAGANLLDLSTGSRQAALASFSPDGGLLWARSYGDGASDRMVGEVRRVEASIVAAVQDLDAVGYTDVAVLRIADDGSVLGQTVYEPASGVTLSGLDVASDGFIVTVGSVFQTWIQRLDASGNVSSPCAVRDAPASTSAIGLTSMPRNERKAKGPGVLASPPPSQSSSNAAPAYRCAP